MYEKQVRIMYDSFAKHGPIGGICVIRRFFFPFDGKRSKEQKKEQEEGESEKRPVFAGEKCVGHVKDSFQKRYDYV